MFRTPHIIAIARHGEGEEKGILSALSHFDQNDLDAVTLLVTAMQKRYM